MKTQSNHFNQSRVRSSVSEPQLLSTVALCNAAGSATLCVNQVGVRHARGKADRKRAGSFLVLVVGTLALLAIITIVFVALGSQDSRTRSATEARAKLDVVPPQMADYIGDIVARDAVATQLDLITKDGTLPIAQQAVRETTDAPGTRYDVLSFTTDINVRFDSVGTVPLEFDPLNPGAIAPSDPWLASTTATDITGATVGAQRPDWYAISNIAPDGAFVNLFDLRNQRPFDVSSTDLRGRVTSTNDWVAGPDLNRPATFSMRQLETHLPAAVGPGTDWADPSMKLYQWADVDGDGWLDSRWFEMRKQVADAGGPGDFIDEISLSDRRTRYFFAARIIDLSALVNIHTATDLMGGPLTALSITGSVAGLTDFPLGLTPADIDVRRLLMGLDAIKDSANPATPDVIGALARGGNRDWPVGSSVNSAQYDGLNSLFIGSRSYLALRLSTQTGLPLARKFGQLDIADIEANVSPADTSAWLVGPNNFEEEFGLASAFNVSRFGSTTEDLIEWRTFFPFGPGTDIASLPGPDELSASGRARLASYLRVVGNPRIESTLPTGIAEGQRAALPFGVQDLAELLERHGVNSDRTSALESALSGRVIGLEALDPLRSNRPQEFELEVADLADTSGNTPFAQAELLKNIDVRSKITTQSGARHVRPVLAPPGKENRMLLSWQTTDRAELIGDPLNENKIDVVAALSNTLYQGSDEPGLTAPILPEPSFRDDTGNSVPTILPGVRDPQVWQLFNGYAAALAPYSILDTNAWDYELGGQGPSSEPFTPGFIGTPGGGDQLQTLFYGHRGPQLALQIAAHMSVNKADIADPDDEPTVATIEFMRNYVRDSLLNGSPPLGVGAPTVTGIAQADNLNADDLLPGYFAMEQPDGAVDSINDLRTAGPLDPERVIANQRLTVEDDVRIASNIDNVVAPVMNVYGIEPQPFITQVGAVAVYQDSDGVLTATGQPPSDSVAGQVRIRGDIDADNHELLYRAVIVQLSNPFDRPIKLSSAPFSDTRLVQNPSVFGGKVVPEPLKDSVAGFPFFDPGSYVAMHDLVNANYSASRLENFYYLDIGDTNLQVVGAVPFEERGKRFVLASLKEKTYASAADQPTPVTISDPALSGRFFRDVVNGVNSVYGAEPTATTTLEPIVIQPGETVTCIGLTRPPSEVSRRLVANDAAFGSPSGANVPEGNDRERILRVIARQFAAELDATSFETKMDNVHWIPQIDVETSEFVGFGLAGTAVPGNPEFHDVVPTLSTDPVRAAQPQYVSLWRSVRGPQEKQPDLTYSWSSLAVTYFNGDAINPANSAANQLYFVKPNNFENDQLADRMMVRTWASTFVPDRASLDVRLKPIGVLANSDYDIDTAVEVSTGDPGENVVSADQMTLTLAAWVRRPRDTETELAHGTIPAWAIEPKYFTRDLSWNIAFRTEVTETIDTAVAGASIGFGTFAADSTGTFSGNAQEVDVWRREMDGTLAAGGSSRPMNDFSPVTAGDRAQLFGKAWVGDVQGVVPIEGVAAYEGATAEFPASTPPPLAVRITIDTNDLSERVASLNTTTAPQLQFADTRVQFFHAENTAGLAPNRIEIVNDALNHRKTLNVLRLTDLLLPAGLGPFSVPINKFGNQPFAQDYSTGPVQLTQFLRRHTTLGEAIAEVMGYSNTNLVSEAASPNGFEAGGVDPCVWFSSVTQSEGFQLFDADTTIRNDETLFDGVNLALDRFVPFFDTNANGVRQQNEPAAMNEIPLALGVMDQFVIAPPALPERLLAPAEAISVTLPKRPLASSTTKAQPGLVNINTAPIEVLRTLPGVAPVTANSSTAGAATASEYDWAFSVLDNQLGAATDFAPALESYRSFGYGKIRPSTFIPWLSQYITPYNTDNLGDGNGQLTFGGYAADVAEAISEPAPGFTPGPGLPPASQRLTGVGVAGFASSAVERGLFRGVGEMLNARFAGPTFASPDDVKSVPIGADYLAYNRNALNERIDTSDADLSRFRAKLTANDGSGPGQTANPPKGYDEKLALVASFANTVTTRSDYYAAWFVVHGYREEDTTNLTDVTQPMIPSVQRRYLMILDRSEVTQLGQKPKVLLMKEVPYEFPARK